MSLAGTALPPHASMRRGAPQSRCAAVGRRPLASYVRMCARVCVCVRQKSSNLFSPPDSHRNRQIVRNFTVCLLWLKSGALARRPASHRSDWYCHAYGDGDRAPLRPVPCGKRSGVVPPGQAAMEVEGYPGGGAQRATESAQLQSRTQRRGTRAFGGQTGFAENGLRQLRPQASPD